MRIARLLLLAFGVLGCSSNTDRSSLQDSASLDTSTFIDEPDSAFVTAADAPAITLAVSRVIEALEKQKNSPLMIKLSASGYEYKTDEVWTFDSLMHLVMCVQDWESEGTEGKTYHVFKNEKLYAIRDENFYEKDKDINVFHKELGGVSYSEGSIDSTANPLPIKYLSDSERELRTRLTEIVKLLRANEQNITGDDPLTLTIINESEDEEMPGRETTEIIIDKKLLDGLLK